MHSDRSVALLAVHEAPHQALDVAVEDDAHELALAVDDGRPGVSADDVVGRDEVHRRREIERGSFIQIPGRQAEWWLEVERLGALVKPEQRRLVRGNRAVHPIPFHLPVREPKGERRIRID